MVDKFPKPTSYFFLLLSFTEVRSTLETSLMWYQQMRSTVTFLKELLRNLINLLEKHLRDSIHPFSLTDSNLSDRDIREASHEAFKRLDLKGII